MTDSMLANLAIPHEKISAFSRRWHIQEFALFGSVLRSDFTPDSDVDVLVRFDDHYHYHFADLMAMESELTEIFGRKVDLIDKKAVEESPNYIRRKIILTSAQVIYAE